MGVLLPHHLPDRGDLFHQADDVSPLLRVVLPHGLCPEMGVLMDGCLAGGDAQVDVDGVTMCEAVGVALRREEETDAVVVGFGFLNVKIGFIEIGSMIFRYIAGFFLRVLQPGVGTGGVQHGLAFPPVGVDGDACILHERDELVSEDDVVVEQRCLWFPDETAGT